MRKSLKIYIAILIAVSLGGLFIMTPKPVAALSGSDWNAANIIDDNIFFNGGTMSPDNVQSFLNAKVPTCDTNGVQPSGRQGYPTRADWGRANGVPPPYVCLKDYTHSFNSVGADSYCAGITGGTKSAATIIYEVARACGVNPQSLIVLLQKEQSLVTDEWPWPNQYRIATGYGCPDGAPCDEQYYGFFNQVYNAGRQFRRYVQEPQRYNYAAGRTSFILYNPNQSCGGTNVTIQNPATAALYNYTPYQPNAAALANLYGTGDGCSAYGNRNFWRLSNDWFGPTTGQGYVLATSFNDNGDSRQWVIYHGIKRLVPDESTLRAWGLQNVPLLQWPGSALGSVPTADPPLTRLMRSSGSQDVYFVDNGKCYRVSGPAMLAAWSFNPAAIIDVSIALGQVPSNSGMLTYSIKSTADATTAYTTDAGSKRRFANTDVWSAWEGDNAPYTTLSTDYFNAMGSGADIVGTKITDGNAGSQEYQVVAGQKLPASLAVAQLYPGSAQTVSSATLNRLVTSAAVSQFIRNSTSPTVYLVDKLTKHTVSSPEVLKAWAAGSSPEVNMVTQGNLNLIPTDSGTPLNSFEADVSGQLYLMDGRKVTIPSNLDSAYRTTGNIYSASTTLMSLLPSGETASDFLKGFSSAPVYLIDTQSLRHVRTPAAFTLWNNGKTITSVSDYVLSQFSSGSSISAYVTDGTTEYIIEAGSKHSVSASIKSNWQLSSPATLSNTTLSRFPDALALSNQLQNSGQYFRVHEGTAFMTVDPNIAELWEARNAPSLNSLVVSEFLRTDMMTKFAKSKLAGDSRLFIVDNGVLYHLSPEQAGNLGAAAQPTMAVNPEVITPSITPWSKFVVQDTAGVMYVIDGGVKRPFASATVQNFWTGNGSVGVPIMTNGFLNTFPTGQVVERAIKGSGMAIYAAENSTKRWIMSPETYNQFYAPYSLVSGSLINALPTGSDIP